MKPVYTKIFLVVSMGAMLILSAAAVMEEVDGVMVADFSLMTDNNSPSINTGSDLGTNLGLLIPLSGSFIDYFSSMLIEVEEDDSEEQELDEDDCDKTCPDAKKAKKAKKAKSKSKGNKGGSASARTPPPPSDITPPTVQITSPSNGATVSGSLQISATASDNVKVTKVEFYYNTNLIGIDTTEPYSIIWNTNTVPNGLYSITVKAFDAAGNAATSLAVNVVVNYTTQTSTPTTQLSVSKFESYNGFLVYESNTLGTYDVAIDHGNGIFYLESMDGSISVSLSHKTSSGTTSLSFSLSAGQYRSINVSSGDSVLVTLTSNNGSVEFAFVFDPS